MYAVFINRLLSQFKTTLFVIQLLKQNGRSSYLYTTGDTHQFSTYFVEARKHSCTGAIDVER